MVLLRGVAQVADNVSAESAPLEYTLIRTLGTGFEKAGQGADAASNPAISRHEVAGRSQEAALHKIVGGCPIPHQKLGERQSLNTDLPSWAVPCQSYVAAVWRHNHGRDL
jgi:hypothetical protein